MLRIALLSLLAVGSGAFQTSPALPAVAAPRTVSRTRGAVDGVVGEYGRILPLLLLLRCSFSFSHIFLLLLLLVLLLFLFLFLLPRSSLSIYI